MRCLNNGWLSGDWFLDPGALDGVLAKEAAGWDSNQKLPRLHYQLKHILFKQAKSSKSIISGFHLISDLISDAQLRIYRTGHTNLSRVLDKIFDFELMKDKSVFEDQMTKV